MSTWLSKLEFGSEARICLFDRIGIFKGKKKDENFGFKKLRLQLLFIVINNIYFEWWNGNKLNVYLESVKWEDLL